VRAEKKTAAGNISAQANSTGATRRWRMNMRTFVPLRAYGGDFLMAVTRRTSDSVG
jgi:hypothetical protein